MREMKRDKSKFEKLIRTVWQETRRGTVITKEEQRKVVSAIQRTLDYFEMNDYLHRVNHTQIFEFVYLSSAKRVSKAKAVTRLPFSEPTIKRRCDEFIRVFDKNYHSDK